MPLAVDTNVLARALVNDGTDQSKTALRCIKENQIWISETVLLETEWLLRSQMGLRRAAVNNVMSKLLSLENVLFSDIQKVATAISAHDAGLDFADALHLLSALHCEAMISFDRVFAKTRRNNPRRLASSRALNS